MCVSLKEIYIHISLFTARWPQLQHTAYYDYHYKYYDY